MKIGRRLKTFIFSSSLSFGWVRACMHKWFSSAPHIFQTLERINTELGENCSIFMICWQQCRGACYQLHSWRYLVNLHCISHSVVKIISGKLQGEGLSLKTFWLQLFFDRIFTYYHFITFLLQNIKIDLDFYRRALLLKLKASTTALKLFLSKAKASELFYPKQRPLDFFIQSKGLWAFLSKAKASELFYPKQRPLDFLIQSKRDYTFFYPKQTLLNHFSPKQRLLSFLSKAVPLKYYLFFIQSKSFWISSPAKQKLLNFFDKKGLRALCMFSGCCLPVDYHIYLTNYIISVSIYLLSLKFIIDILMPNTGWMSCFRSYLLL